MISNYTPTHRIAWVPLLRRISPAQTAPSLWSQFSAETSGKHGPWTAVSQDQSTCSPFPLTLPFLSPSLLSLPLKPFPCYSNVKQSWVRMFILGSFPGHNPSWGNTFLIRAMDKLCKTSGCPCAPQPWPQATRSLSSPKSLQMNVTSHLSPNEGRAGSEKSQREREREKQTDRQILPSQRPG